MAKTKALENLAEGVIFGTATPDTLKSLGLNLKKGKAFKDVLRAKQLKDGQQPGDFERMVAHVERNLAEVVV